MNSVLMVLSVCVDSRPSGRRDPDTILHCWWLQLSLMDFKFFLTEMTNGHLNVELSCLINLIVASYHV